MIDVWILYVPLRDSDVLIRTISTKNNLVEQFITLCDVSEEYPELAKTYRDTKDRTHLKMFCKLQGWKL